MSLGGIVARNIRRLREERGLTQEELAARIRINRNYVGMIERQENSPTVAMLERIAKALGIEPAQLFDEKAAGRRGSGSSGWDDNYPPRPYPQRHGCVEDESEL